MRSGRIIKALSGFYYVESEGVIYQCRGRGVFRKREINPLVGDFVEFEVSGELEGYINKVAPRSNELQRPPVANIDQALIVTSALEPKFSPLLLDRFLVLIEAIDVEPVIIISKIDLANSTELEELRVYQEIYKAIGYSVELTSIKDVTDHVDPYLKDKVSVIAGQSGVGKSALLNAINQNQNLKTDKISQSLGRGKHTTRHVELIPVAGGLVADTPGFSTLEFETLEAENLSYHFREFRERQGNCKFRACKHDQEPGCAIKEAVENEDVATFRYKHYLKFLKEIESRKPRY